MQNGINSIWRNALKDTLSGAAHRDTLEVLNHKFEVPMENPILTDLHRKASLNFMAAEALWIISGRRDLGSLTPYAPSYKRFSDDGISLYGAYGPKFVYQKEYVVKCLTEDHTSRQGVINIWRQNPKASKDIPCTLSLAFYIRENKLHLSVSMRSNDVWLGLPYDAFSFSAMGMVIAQRLGVKLGVLNITATSRHLYNKHYDRALEVLANPKTFNRADVPSLSYKEDPKITLSNFLNR